MGLLLARRAMNIRIAAQTLSVASAAELTEEMVTTALRTDGSVPSAQLEATARAVFERIRGTDEFRTGRDVTLSSSDVAGLVPALPPPSQSVGALRPSGPSLATQLSQVPPPDLGGLLEPAPPVWASTVSKTLASTLGPSDPPSHVSLALIDLAKASQEPPKLRSSYLAHHYTYTACHDVAAELNKLMGVKDSAPVVVADSADPSKRTGAAQRAIKDAIDSGNAVIHVRYTAGKDDGHSFTLVATAQGVERLEGWAGGDGSRGGSRVTSLGLHECLTSYELPPLTPKQAKDAVDAMLSPSKETRTAALGVTRETPHALSRGGLYGFEATAPLTQMVLEVTVRPLDTPDNIKAKLSDKLADVRAFADKTVRDTQKEAIDDAVRSISNLLKPDRLTSANVTRELNALGKGPEFRDAAYAIMRDAWLISDDQPDD